MPRHKQAVAEVVQPIPGQQAEPPSAETDRAPVETPQAEPPARKFRANPFRVKTETLDGYKVELQESRHEGQRWQMQIKFGDGHREDMPPVPVIDFIKSHKTRIQTENGSKEVNLFHWNGEDRAWGMTIDFDMPNTSRRKAEQIFDQVVDLVAQERGTGPQR